MKPSESITILMIYASPNNNRLAYVKCSCGRNVVMDRYFIDKREYVGCPCGARDGYRQRLSREIAMQYYKDKLNQYWEENYDIANRKPRRVLSIG